MARPAESPTSSRSRTATTRSPSAPTSCVPMQRRLCPRRKRPRPVVPQSSSCSSARSPSTGTPHDSHSPTADYRHTHRPPHPWGEMASRRRAPPRSGRPGRVVPTLTAWASRCRVVRMSLPALDETRALHQEGTMAEDVVLAVLTGQARGTRKRLGAGLRIGTAPDNDLVLPDDTVSRHHCELVRQTDGVLVRDLGSTNHTRIGQAVVREVLVEVGTTLSIGGVDVVLRAEPNGVAVPPSSSPRFGHALGPSLAMRTIFGVLERIAPTDASVLLEGETGTGKDVLARSVHDRSSRREEPF